MRKILFAILCLAMLCALPSCGKRSAEDTGELRDNYPEYFDLSTAKGLEVYFWQMASESYSFGLLPGTNREKSAEELWNLKGVSAEEMKRILSAYDVNEDDVAVIPFQHPISSYIAPYWISPEGEEPDERNARRQEYVSGIRELLFPGK